MSSGEQSAAAPKPSVGNILGFGLMFRDRRALLAIHRRGLAQGVKLRDYEAEIPNVQFPLKGPLSAVTFRQRRCRALKVTLSVEARAIKSQIVSRLVGLELEPLRIVDVDVDLRGRVPGVEGHRPSILIEFRRDDGTRGWLVGAFELEPRGRELRVRPGHLWWIGHALPEGADARSLWIRIARRIAGGELRFEPQSASLDVDPARLALFGSFVRSGWKAPDLSSLTLETLSLSRRALGLELREGQDDPMPDSEPMPSEDPIRDALDGARAQLSGDRLDDALDTLEELNRALRELPAARLALARWRVQLARWRRPERAADAIRDWLDLKPSAADARRMLAVGLARRGDASALARALAADCRSSHPPMVQARLELALATLLVERLDDPRSSLALVGPLVSRVRHEEALREAILPGALVCLAQARAAEAGMSSRLAQAPHAFAALDEALALTSSGARRSDYRARVARSFAAQGAYAPALRLLMTAIGEDPDSHELLDDAIELSSRVGEAESAAALLRLRLQKSSISEEQEHRRRLIAVLSRIDTDAAATEALDHLRVALDVEPDARDLLERAVKLEAASGDRMVAAEHLGRLIEDFDLDADERRAHAIERAGLLQRDGQLDAAWESLRDELERDVEAPQDGQDASQEAPAQSLDLLELALELAPPTDRAGILDRLIARARGPRRGRALVERAAQSFDVQSRIVDLWAATEELDDARPVLEQLEPLVADDDLRELRRLAHAAQSAGEKQLGARTHARLGLAFYARAQYEETVAELLSLHEAGLTGPRLTLVLARSLDAMGRGRLAQPLYQRVLESGYDEESEGRGGTGPELPPLPELLFRVVRVALDQGDDALADSLLAARASELEEPAMWLEANELRFIASLRGQESSEQGAPAAATSKGIVESVLEALDEGLELPPAEGRESESATVDVRVRWLGRAVDYVEGRTRLTHLGELTALRPDDMDLALAYDEEMRRSGADIERESHLRSRIQQESFAEQLPELHAELAELLERREAPTQERIDVALARLELDGQLHEVRLQTARWLEELGRFARALEHWRLADEALPLDDPRRLEASRALALHESQHENWQEARRHIAAWSALDPHAPELANLVRVAADSLDDPALALQAAELQLERFALTNTQDESEAGPEAPEDESSEAPDERRAALQIERARALLRLERLDEAVDALRRGARQVETRSVTHLELAETWLELAKNEGSSELEREARAELRRALGRDLGLDQLCGEIDLLLSLEAVDAAVDLAGRALVERGAPDELLERLRATAEHTPERVLPLLEAALPAHAESEQGEALARQIIELAHRLERPEVSLSALERFGGAGVREPELARERDWAIDALDAQGEEIERLDALLVEGSIASERSLVVERLARLLDDDQLLARRLLAAADRADDPRAITLIELALGLEPPVPLDLRVEALARAARRRLEALFSREWLAVAREASEGPSPEQVIALLRLASASERTGETRNEAEGLLTHCLLHRPEADALTHLVWEQSADEGLSDGELDDPELARRRWQRFAARLDELAAPLEAERYAKLLDAAAAQLRPQQTPDFLAAAVRRHAEDPLRRRALLEGLWKRGAWPLLLDLLPLDLDGTPSERADAWLQLSQAAAADQDAATHVGSLLRAAEAQLEDEDFAAAALTFEAILESDADRHDIRLRLAQARHALDQHEAARRLYLQLIEDEVWDAAGIDRSELFRLAGELSLEADDLEAVALLRAVPPPSPESPEAERRAEQLFAAHLRLDDPAAALAVALERINTHRDPERRLEWNQRAIPLSNGAERARLLEDLLLLAPESEARLEELSALYEELGDDGGLEKSLRRRLEHATDDERESLLAQLLDILGRDPSRTLELPALRERYLEHRPRDVDLLLQVAEDRGRRGKVEARNEAWSRAFLHAAEDDERLAAPALELGRAAVDAGDPDAADLYLARAQALSSDPLHAIDGRLELARIRQDAATILELAGLRLELSDRPRVRAALRVERAEAHTALGAPEEAARSWSRAIEERNGDAPAQRDLTDAWLAWTREQSDADEPDGLARELEARQAMRKHYGEQLPPADFARELDLLVMRERHETVVELVTPSLLRDPKDGALRQRLRDARNAGANESYLRAMRSVVEACESGSARDDLAVELAHAAREDDAARSALGALEQLSPEAAAEKAMLDVREWALRSLGEVDTELSNLDDQLRSQRGDDVLLERLLRMLEHDELATGRRLLDLADEAEGPSARSWLLTKSLDLIGRRGAEAISDLLRAIEAGSQVDLPTAVAERRVRQLALEARDESSLIRLCTHLQTRGVTRRPELFELLADALELFPQTSELHALVQEALQPKADVDTHRRWLDDLVDLRDGDERLRGRLYLGCATVQPDPTAFIVDMARRHQGRPPLRALLWESLRGAGCWPELYELHAEIEDLSADRWQDFAQMAAEASADAVATHAYEAAAPRWFEAGKIEETLACIESLRTSSGDPSRLRALECRALDHLASTSGDRPEFARPAFEAWRALLASGQSHSPLSHARRAAQLAAALDDLTGQRDMLEIAWTHAGTRGEMGLHALLADNLFEAHRKANASAAATALAAAMIHASRDDESRLRWHLRAAELSEGETRATHLRAAHDIDPREETADALEGLLEELDARPRLRELLTLRVERALSRGDEELARAKLARLCESHLDETLPREDEAHIAALERYLRFEPEAVEHRMRLAQLHADCGNLRSALGHWELAAPALPDEDPRMLAPALRLAEDLRAQGRGVDALDWYRRALLIEPDHRPALEALLTLGLEHDRPETVIDACTGLLDHHGEESPETPGWQALRGEHRITLGQLRAGLADLRTAAGPEDIGIGEHGFASRWLENCEELASREELDDELRAHVFAERLDAYALLRTRQGEQFALQSRLREAELRFAAEQGSRASELLVEGIGGGLDAVQLYPALEHGLSQQGDPRLHIRVLLRCLEVLTPEALHERCARQVVALGAEHEDAQATLAGLDALPEVVAEGGEFASLREWAVQELGQTQGELARLESIARKKSPAGILARMRRLIGELDDTVERGLVIANDEGLDAPRRVDIAMQAFDMVRSEAPENFALPMRLVECLLSIDPGGADALEGRWPELVPLAIAQQHAEPIFALAEAALGLLETDPARRSDELQRLVHELLVLRLRHDGQDERTHDLTRRAALVLQRERPWAWTRALCIEAQADPEELSASDSLRLLAALSRAELDEGDWARQLEGFAQPSPWSPGVAPLVEALQEAGRWAELDRLTPLATEVSEDDTQRERVRELAALARSDDPQLARRMHMRAGEHALKAEEVHPELRQAARKDFEAAQSIENDPRLALRLGRLFEVDERWDAALEHLLPLTRDELAAQVELDLREHLLHCAALLRRTGQLERAATFMARAMNLSDADEAEALAQELFPLWIEAGRKDQALELAREQARDRARHPEGADWLKRAASLADSGDRIRLLRTAWEREPTDFGLAEELAAELRRTADKLALTELLDQRLALDEATTKLEGDAHERRVKLLRERLQLLRERLDSGVDQGDPHVRLRRIELLRELSAREAQDVDVLLSLAELLFEADDDESREEALASWWRAGELLEHEDDRFFAPAHVLATHAAERGEVEAARDLLQRALAIRPGTTETLAQLRTCAEVLGDDALLLRCLAGLVQDGQDANERAGLERAAALALLRQGHAKEAFSAFERASILAEGSHFPEDLAREWLRAAIDHGTTAAPSDQGSAARFEAEARANLRRVRGDELAIEELLGETELLASRLADENASLDLLIDYIPRWPHEEILHAMLRERSISLSRVEDYARGLLDHAETLDDMVQRDALLRRRAFLQMELVDAKGVLATLDRMQPETVAKAELLDLRDWAIRELGELDTELDALDQDLLANPEDPLLIERLLRGLDRDPVRAAEHLLRLHLRKQENGPSPLARKGLDMVLGASDDGATLVKFIGALAMAEDGEGARARWSEVAAKVVAGKDAEALASLVSAALRLESDGEVDPGSRELLQLGFAENPSSEALHACFWQIRGANGFEEAELILGELEAQLDGLRVAELWIGFVARLERRERVHVLSRRAHARLHDAAAFAKLVEALEGESQWAEALALWEARLGYVEEASDTLPILKHLAHLATNVLGDPEAAVDYLEQALAIDPVDPDLLLPLLDHYYAQPQLDRAIALSHQVLEHVPMGNVAYAALGNRAADAALARGEHEAAQALLARVLERVPEDKRTLNRAGELEALAGDPDHRVGMLAAIAARQGGSARVEALEERARLLAQQLGRVDEAITDLETVLEESPQRQPATSVLMGLYRERERWPELVVLLERSFASAAGDERIDLLIELATVQRLKLYDLPRAEQSLMLVIDAMRADDDPDPRLDAQIDALTSVLEQQGRHAEMIEQLRVHLAYELDGGRTLATARVPLAERLANALREYTDDSEEAARVYSLLERSGHLPESGLATLARWYHAQQRHDDLVRVLQMRSQRLEEEGDQLRRAEAEIRIGELLEGAMRQPHKAADHFLNAYLTDPNEFADAGKKARVLLAGTDSVINVRARLLERAKTVKAEYRPALLTLLGDLLAPHEEHESEAETVYRRAIGLDHDLAHAHEGLGRLLARQARLDEAVDPLVEAATSEQMEPYRAADNAATAARALLELGRAEKAERVLKQALGRAPDAQRTLLELARLYDRTGRNQDQGDVLDELSNLPLSSILRAEVAYRRAMLLEEEFRLQPLSESGETARAYLLEAVSSDNMHAQARQVLLELATARSEWSIVAHMYYLQIRELQPGPHRAQIHLDLSEVYLERLADHDSAVRNLASALSQAPRESLVARRASEIAGRLTQPGEAAAQIEAIAEGDEEITFDGLGRLYLLASDLWLRAEEIERAERAVQSALKLPDLHNEVESAARRALDGLTGDDAELRKERAGLLRLLESEDHAAERMHIFGRLREIGAALEDAELVTRADAEQLELAHRLLQEEADPVAAAAHLRELLAEHDDHDRVLELYDTLAAERSDAVFAARLWTDAARFAWTGKRSSPEALLRLRKALGRNPNSKRALALLGEIADSREDPAVDTMMCEELDGAALVESHAALSLRIADAALRLGREQQAETVYLALVHSHAADDLRLSALHSLDALLERAGRQNERMQVLRWRWDIGKVADPANAGDVALELVRMLRAAGAYEDAQSLCAEALDRTPGHRELTHLYAELLDLAQDWPALAGMLEQLAALSIDANERAMWLTRAARIHLLHGTNRESATQNARALLAEACNASPENLDARAELLPLAFSEGRWDEVLELAVQLRSIAGDDHESLVYAALVEAYVHGRRTLARSIGARHDRTERQRSVWPATATVLDRVAYDGPLPRLDAVIGAAASLCGGTQQALDELASWSVGHPMRAGTQLALARLWEAAGNNQVAGHLYQLAAFMAPAGPVQDLVRRLPPVELPMDPLRNESWIPLEWRCATREVLIQLRTRIAGIRPPTPPNYVVPESTHERAAIQSAGRITAPWRESLGMSIPIRITREPLPMGISVRNETEPLIVLNGSFIELPEAERTFRLALAATTIATGLALLDDSYPSVLNDLIEALVGLVKPRHQILSEGARAILEGLASAGMTGAKLPAALRENLTRELGHWYNKSAQLEHVIRRSRLLLATYLCGRLDGALSAMARDRGLIVDGDPPDGTTVLDTDDARWLLLSLGVFGLGFDPAAGQVI